MLDFLAKVFVVLHFSMSPFFLYEGFPGQRSFSETPQSWRVELSHISASGDASSPGLSDPHLIKQCSPVGLGLDKLSGSSWPPPARTTAGIGIASACTSTGTDTGTSSGTAGTE